MPAGRQWTVSIAVASSVIDNTQNTEFATYVAGQIARAAAIFNVDEVGMQRPVHRPGDCITHAQ